MSKHRVTALDDRSGTLASIIALALGWHPFPRRRAGSLLATSTSRRSRLSNGPPTRHSLQTGRGACCAGLVSEMQCCMTMPYATSLCGEHPCSRIKRPVLISKHKRSHGVERDDIKEGTHYKLVGIRDVCVVEMVETAGNATFRVLRE